MSNNTKTIDELHTAWQRTLPHGKYPPTTEEAYRAGHLQASKDSLELLKRAYDAIEDGTKWDEMAELLEALNDQIGYIEEQIKEQEV